MSKPVNVLIVTMLAASLLACAQMQPREKLDVTRSNKISTTATVESVDMAERVVRLKTALGYSIVVHAGNAVKNLDQVKVGDLVAVEYYESLAVRMAEPGEVKSETMEIQLGSEPGAPPARGAGRQSTITATILAIDRQAHTVTLKGPDGTIVTVDVRQPEHLEKVRVGDTIVITYTEAIAMSIQKIAK